jgi:ABC-type molybdate transport system substrate-binding protein
MNTLKIFAAAAALFVAGSTAPAFADAASSNGHLVAVGSQQAAAPVTEGRQAAPVASPSSTTDADRFVIDRSQGER